MLEILRIPREERLDDRSQVLSLIDLFPAFLELCSAMSITEDEDALVEALGKFLLQAVLEQYTLFGKTAIEAITHASSLLSSHHHPSSQNDRKKKWLSAVQSRYLTILLPPSPTASQQSESQETHLNRLAQQFPAFDFEAMLVMRLQSFLFGLETPVLVKLETGEMNLYGDKNRGGNER